MRTSLAPALACALTLAIVALDAPHPRAVASQDAAALDMAPIVSLVRAGDDERARAMLLEATHLADDGAYLLARLHERNGELSLARAAYARVNAAALPSVVQDDLHLRLGRLLLAAGDAAGAEGELAAIGSGSRASRALLAECAVLRGDAESAERRLRAAIAEEGDDTDGFALRLLLAEVLAAGDQDGEAIATLRRVVVDRPEHPDDASAWAAARSIAGTELSLSLTDRLVRIAHLSERHQHERALAESAALTLPPAGRERAEALHVVGMAHYRARQEDQANALLTEAAGLGGPHATEDEYHAVRALHRRAPDRANARGLRAFARAHPEHALATEAEYLGATTELDLDPPRGRRSLARFSARHTTGDYAHEAAFRLAMDAFDRERWDDATERLTRLSSAGGDALERLRIRYWLARVLEARGRWALARAAYLELVHASPLHYYALLSRQRLLAEGEPDPAPFPEGDVAATAPASIEWPEAAAFFRALGLDADAARILRAQESRLRSAHGLRAVVEAYLTVGGWDRAYRLVAGNGLLDRPLDEDNAWAWRAAYPAAFEDEVRSAATESHVEPELVWAIMRQESAYEAGVVSVSDAIGLMQLLPSTAARVANDLGTPFRRELLFTPRFNVRVGARYLSDLITLVGVPAAFAAYNAGEHRVAQWWAAPACRGEWALDRFVDWIPFAQTRGYVRRVASHYLRYLYLREPSRGWPDARLPATAADGRPCDRGPGDAEE